MSKMFAVVPVFVCLSVLSVGRAQETPGITSRTTGSLANPNPKPGQARGGSPFELKAVKEDKAANGVIVTYVFSFPVKGYASSFFTWTPLKPPPQSSPSITTMATFDSGDPSKVSSTIAYPVVADVDAVAVFGSIADASGTVLFKTPEFTIDLSDTRLLDVARSQNSSLTQKVAALQAEVTNWTQAYNGLRTNILPKVVSFDRYLFVSDSSIVLKFVTDNFGIIEVTTKEAPRQVIRTPPGKDHVVRFDRLMPSMEYHFEASVIDPAKGTLTDVHTNPADPLLSKKTLDSKPMIVFSPAVQPLNSAVKVQINSDHVGSSGEAPRLAYNVSWRKVLSESPFSTTQEVAAVNGFRIGDAGIPDSKFDQEGSVIIGSLTPNTKYEVFVEAVDELGRAYNKTKYSATTLGGFDFDGPINVEISPTGGITANWKATRAPKTAEMTIKFQSADVTLKSNADGHTNPVLAKSGAPQVFAALNKALVGETPIMHIEMKSDSEESASRDFSVSFVVPKKPQSVAGMDKSNTDAVGNLSKAATDGSKKVSWKDILSSGLNILLKAL